MLDDDTLRPDPDDGDEGPIGIFPSWRAVYWSVAIYTLILVVILAVFTSVFDFSVG